jgi:hypothetical protein
MKIIFRTNYPGPRSVAGFLKPRRDEDIADRIEQLTVGDVLVQTPEGRTRRSCVSDSVPRWKRADGSARR